MTLTLEIYNNNILVKGFEPEEKKVIYQACSHCYEYYGMDYSLRPPKAARQEAYINYYNREEDSFPTGWLSPVGKALRENNIPYDYRDCRIKPEADDNSWLKRPLWPLRPEYQPQGLKKCLNVTRGIIKWGTGAGKTVLMMHLVESLRVKTLILVPDLNLLYQMYQGLEEDDLGFKDFFGEERVGMIGDGVFKTGDVIVATVPSMWAGLKRQDPAILKILAEAEALFIDESHHVSIAGRNKIKNSYYHVCQATNAYWRFAFTATPGDEGTIERSLVEAVTGKVLHEISTSELIGLGYLTRPEIYIVPNAGLGRYSDWTKAYKENILDNKIRNNTIAEICRGYNAQGKTVLVIVKRVEKHGAVLKELIPNSALMTGKTTGEERKQMFKDFSSKKLLTLISTVIKEGTNIPSMDVIVIAAGGKSDKALVQWIGRVLRKAKNKLKAIIIDFLDDDGSRGMLRKHSNQRIRTYKKEEAYDVVFLREGEYKRLAQGVLNV